MFLSELAINSDKTMVKPPVKWVVLFNSDLIYEV